jgi:hypothetical protein
MIAAGWKSGARRSVNDARLSEQAEEVAAALLCRPSALAGCHRKHCPDLGAVHALSKPRFKLEIVTGSPKEALQGIDPWDGGPVLDSGNGRLRDATGGGQIPLGHPAPAARRPQHPRSFHATMLPR